MQRPQQLIAVGPCWLNMTGDELFSEAVRGEIVHLDLVIVHSSAGSAQQGVSLLVAKAQQAVRDAPDSAFDE